MDIFILEKSGSKVGELKGNKLRDRTRTEMRKKKKHFARKVKWKRVNETVNTEQKKENNTHTKYMEFGSMMILLLLLLLCMCVYIYI